MHQFSLFFATWRLLWAHMKCALELLWQLVWAKNDSRRSGKTQRLLMLCRSMPVCCRGCLPAPCLPCWSTHCKQDKWFPPLTQGFFRRIVLWRFFSCIWDTRPLKLIPKLSLLLSMVEGNCLLIKNQTVLWHGKFHGKLKLWMLRSKKVR